MKESNQKVEEKFQEELKESDVFTDELGSEDKLPGLENYSKYNYPWFLNRVANRLNKGYSPIIVISGEERSGKSELAQLILHYLHNKSGVLKGDIDKESIKEHLTYDVLEFIEFIQSNKRTGIIVDEAGSLLKATRHQSHYNEAADEVIQTMGFKNNLYIFITPQFTRLDKKIRSKADIVLEVIGRGKVKATGINTNFGKIRTREKELRKVPLPPFTPERPPASIRKGYDEKEKDFKNSNLNEKYEKMMEEKKEDEKIDVDDLI